MSSMWRVACLFPFLLAAATSGSAQYRPQYGPVTTEPPREGAARRTMQQPAPPVFRPSVQPPAVPAQNYVVPQPVQAPASSYTVSSLYAGTSVGTSLNEWRTLRQSGNYSFGQYARFLIANPAWPGETTLRRSAERAMRPGEHAPTVIAFFANSQPLTGGGHARFAEALAAQGRMNEAMLQARAAWASDDLSSTDEQMIYARFGQRLTAVDHDRRVDALLFAKKATDASRFYSMTSPARRAAFAARIAMQRNDASAPGLYGSVIQQVTSDAGLMMDRARYLRENQMENYARDLAARPRNFVYRPADPERFLDMLLLLADGAAQDRQWQLAYNISRQLDDVLPPGTPVSSQPIAVRDTYTSLAWLAGTTALDRTGQASAAIAMFDRYARGGQSLQVATKGYYWAGRAALAAGRAQDANSYFQRAGAYPELFYGQLALERLGRAPVQPLAASSLATITPNHRAAFYSNRLVQAVRILAQQGRSNEQALFVRALAESLNSDVDRALAAELGQQVARPDLGVWIARAARTKGTMFYARQAFPSLPAQVSGRLWALAHGITRQESSFNPYAISHAGARGMMQLMPGTAREQAGKMGVAYDPNRVLSDPNYNIMLGSAYFQRMLDMWDGNVPLAVASYNAGYGNVRKWVARYGDPRSNVDVLKWIEAIPFSETRAYVQRVIENSVVYDTMRNSPHQSAMHVSRFLGKSRPG